MRLQRIKIISILFCIFFTAVSNAQEAQAPSEMPSLISADQMMSQGDCENAILLYRIAYRETSDNSKKTNILLKISDCAMRSSEPTLAKRSLQLASKLAPADDRLKLKSSELLFYQLKFEELIALPNNKKPVRGDLRAQHDILVGRSLMELQDYERGLQILDSVPLKKDTASVLHYWKAVALFNLEDYKKSGDYFQKSIDSAAPNEWTIKSSRSWLPSLKEAEKVFYPKLKLGLLYESNLGRRSFAESNTTEPNPGSYLREGGLSIDFSGLYFLVKKSSFKFYTIPELSQILYAKHYPFHFTNLGLRTGLDYKLSEELLMAVQLGFAKTKFNFVDYQDVRTSSGVLKWQVGAETSLSYSADFANLERSPTLYAFSHSVFLNQDIADATYWAGLLYRESHGTKAQVMVIPGQFPTVSDGELFSRYQSKGLLIGSTRTFDKGKSLDVQIMHLRTAFADENVPASANAFVSSKETRTDQQWSVFSSYNWPLAGRMTQSLGANLVLNKSTGFQGFSNGRFPSANYDSQTLTYQIQIVW